ncbi:class I SAM-dependent methyltransferase [Reinekea thalattae]|uniref:class I SAM-dependent methyltransferase n=1 Tax=Reinekea thalattae TaxID=2593301 RepID=UPI0016501588|nr:class I SAM-dependent methyltransferase [Reinekea thalattae]
MLNKNNTNKTAPADCPLCSSHQLSFFSEDKKRTFFQCQNCQLVFTEQSTWPSAHEEKAIYDLHENDVDDSGYNQFLNRIVSPLKERLSPPAQILDFGCGPAPALAKQLQKEGFDVSLYDSFYQPNNTVLEDSYHAIVATEVIEHLHQPRQELEKLWQQLKPNGWLALMTQRVKDVDAFERWQYKNDPTHVCFYHEQSFYWLAEAFGAQAIEFVGRDMVFIQKGA